MKYLITGGCGFIGFHLAKELLNKKEEVIIIDNFNNFYNPRIKKQRAKILNKATIYKQDILNYQELKKIFKHHSFDKVIHLAAQPGVLQSINKKELYQKNNIKGTENIFRCCAKFNIKNIVFASSSSVYRGNKTPFKEDCVIKKDISFYAQTKRKNELLAKTYSKKYKLNINSLRLFNVYGPNGRPDLVFYIFTEALLKNKNIIINGDGETLRDFTYVTDIVNGIVKASNLNLGFQIINLGHGKPITLNKLVFLLEKITKKKAIKIYRPKNQLDMTATFADISKAKNLLNWQPEITINQGLKKLINWHKKK